MPDDPPAPEPRSARPAATPAQTAAAPPPPPASTGVASIPPAKAPSATAGSEPTPQPAQTLGDVLDRTPARHDQISARVWEARAGAKVVGNVAARSVQLKGPTGIRGQLTADRVDAVGSLDIVGGLTVRGDCSLTGDARVGGVVSVGSLALQGTLSASQGVTAAGALSGKGRILTPKDLRATTVQFEGSVDVGGTLKAGDVDLTVTAESRVGTILAQTVRVSSHHRALGKSPELTALRIEASDVVLEAVRCEYVRAERISLGRDAHVARWDGSIVRRDARSRAGPESNSPPPYGLTR